MRWTNEQAVKAQANHTYIKVGAKGGEWSLTGAERQWKKPATANVVYIPQLRIVGSPVEITQLLQTLQLPQGEIAAYLASGYTAANTVAGAAMSGAFAAELAQAQAFKAAKKAQEAVRPAAPAVTLEVLAAWAAQLPGAHTVTARTATAGAAAGAGRAASPRRGGRKKTLAERLRAAQTAGKVLDVSNIDNIKMVTRPAGKTAKIGPAGVPVVSSSFENFAAAMRQLGASYEQYIGAYQAMIAGRVAPVAPIAGLAMAPLPRVPSPARVPQIPAMPAVARVPSPRQAVVPAIPQLAPLPTVGRAASPRGTALPQLRALPTGLPTIPRL